jgi:hypothetical protein
LCLFLSFFNNQFSRHSQIIGNLLPRLLSQFPGLLQGTRFSFLQSLSDGFFFLFIQNNVKSFLPTFFNFLIRLLIFFFQQSYSILIFAISSMVDSSSVWAIKGRLLDALAHSSTSSRYLSFFAFELI